ncbi:MAG: universal stress protein [Desulfobacterales bacterium]|nr:universal stress protein [Desulfobacterales bacterium]
MKKNVLIAIDDSNHSRQAVQYALAMSRVMEDLTCTLFHVQPSISQYILEEAEKDPAARGRLKGIINKNREKAEAVLEQARERMLNAGADEARIKTVSMPKLSGIAKDIMDYSLTNQLDAVVVGRRGVSKVQEAVLGSVTAKLLQHSRVTPVWVVSDNKEPTRIMAAVDGSESSLRLVDHVCFMLKGSPGAALTLLHVKPRFRDFAPVDFEETDEELGELLIQGEKRRVENFFGHASKMLREAGIGENQVAIRDVVCNINVGKTIVNEARKGNCGTVVVGRSGMNNSFFMGSVSRYVLDKTSNRAIWLVP